MSVEILSIPGAGGRALPLRLQLPVDGRPAAFALLAHCFACGSSETPELNLGRALAARRIGVLSLDFTGLGDAGGEAVSRSVADLLAAAQFLAQRHEAPRILLGHSIAGTAMLRAAAQVPAARAVATIAAPFDLGAGSGVEDGRMRIGGSSFSLAPRLLDELAAVDAREAVHRLRRALLLFHAPLDRVVNVVHAARIFDAALHPKSFISLDHADHLLSDDADSCYVGAVTAAWARKYVEVPAEPADASVEDRNRVVARGEASGYRTHIMVRGHALTADEPLSAGGSDSGPNPYDLLLAGLGACTAMTLRMYADRKGWALRGPVVRLTHEKIHAADCPECDQSQPRIDRITRELELPGDLSEEQRQRLLEIADRCPVHRTLESKVLIKTSLRD